MSLRNGFRVNCYLGIGLITFFASNVTYGMLPTPNRPVQRQRRPLSTIIQESKVLRHFPSLTILTFKYEMEDHSFYFRTIVTDLDDPSGTHLYDKITYGWFECQLEHFYATAWAIQTFPSQDPIPATPLH